LVECRLIWADLPEARQILPKNNRSPLGLGALLAVFV